jgi:hypothetical protein
MTGIAPRLATAAAVAALALISAPRAAAAPFVFVFNNHTYQFFDDNRTWISAANRAKSLSVAGATGYLVEINSAAENAEIFSRLTANVPAANFTNTRAPDGGNGAYVYIGHTDRAAEGAWLVDGDGDGVGPQFWQGTKAGNSVGGLYQNWGVQTAQNEPDNANNQDVAGISLNGWPLGPAGMWNDVQETNALFYMVEFNAVPEPAAGLLPLLGGGVVFMRRRTR